MTKEQFQVGMRVTAVDFCDDTDLRGKTGTVRVITSGKVPIGVEFDEGFDGGHTLTNRLEANSRRGWWCEPGSLIREDGTRLVIEVAGVETTIKGFIGGRDVDAKVKCADGNTPNAYVGARMALDNAFGIEEREAKRGEYVVVVCPRAPFGYTMGDVLRMVDRANGENTRNDMRVNCVPIEYVVVRDPAIFHPKKHGRKAVCIKAADVSPFIEGRIYTVNGDGTINTGIGKLQTHQQEDERRIAIGKNRFFIIDEPETEAEK